MPVPDGAPGVAVFGPHPLLTVTIERRGGDADDVHLHPLIDALAAALARGLSFEDALVLGAAAGAANFLRHGLGTAEHVDDAA